MTTTIGSVDLNALSDLYNDANQYFWFEGDASATYGSGVHITLSPDTSFVANPSGQNILINTDGISIRNGLLPMMTLDNDSLDFNVINTTTGTYDNVASFGSTAIVIGEEANANLHLTFNNLSMLNRENSAIFEVGDNRNAEGIATVKHTATVSVNSAGTATVTVKSNISSIVSVYADSVQLSSSSYSFSQKTVTINNLTANSKTSIEITYTTTESTVYLTFGERDSSGNIGNYSIAEGIDVIASGYASHAEGRSTRASGANSHAEGDGTTANGWASHAEGYYTTASEDESHAEGRYTTASGYASHAEGRSTRASGDYSHAEGYYTKANEWASHAEGYSTTASATGAHAGGLGTVADGEYMTAIGKHNTEKSGKAFVIGNGTSTARSDAFAVDWEGNVYAQGNKILATAEKIQNMLCTSYPETLTVTAGTFTNDGCRAALVGNSLRLAVIAKAKNAITAGDIANQTMLTITFVDDKIADIYAIGSSGATSGPGSQMGFNVSSSGGQHTITVKLASLAQNLNKDAIIDAYVSIPCELNWDAY